MSKTLVAYFSATGTTKHVAERLAKSIGADLFEIKAAEPYTDADLDWRDRNSRSSVEMSDLSSRPEIAQLPDDLRGYDTVFIGFPIWWYTAPTIILNFLEHCDLWQKTVVPFATSGGSGMGQTLAVLRQITPNANWKEGRVIGQMSDQALADWAKSI